MMWTARVARMRGKRNPVPPFRKNIIRPEYLAFLTRHDLYVVRSHAYRIKNLYSYTEFW
jgi:hypothetical protein